MRKINRREKRIFYIAAGTVIFSLIFNLSVDPLIKRHKKADEEIGLLELKLRRYLRFLNEGGSLDPSLSGKTVFSDALTEVKSLAEQSGIRIVEISQQNWKPRKLYKERLITLRTQGDIERFMGFIYNMEDSLSLLKIKRAEFSAVPKAETLEAVFSISEKET